MARSSRHRSHRSHKHRDRSDSEEEEARVSDTEKRRSSSGNGDFSAEGGKKRKERGEDSAAADRWNGGGEDVRVGKELNEDVEVVDVEKSSKPKEDGADLKGKSSSRRREGSSERNEEKRRSEKELSRRESSSSSQYKEGKEKDREKERERERVTEKDKRAEDDGSKKEERAAKKDSVISELQDKDSQLEKELEKPMKRRRDGSGHTDNLQGDGKETDARHISSKDDYSKNGSYKDERYNDGRYKEKYRDDLDRDQRQRDDKRRDEPTSRIRTSDRSDSKYSRDDSRLSESRYKTKLQESDHDGSSHVDDKRTEPKENRGKKRSSDENEDSSDLKPRNTKESQEDTERNRSRSGRLNSNTDRAREHPHQDKVDSGLSNSRPKDQTRHNSRQAEPSRGEPFSEETHPRTASRGDHRVASGSRERVSESRSTEKTKLKVDTCSDALISEASVASQYDKTLRSDNCNSPNHLSRKSPTSTIDRRSERIGARRILDVEEVGQRSSNCKDGKSSSSSKDFGRDQELPVDKLKGNDSSQVDLLSSERTTLGPSSYSRTANSQCTSPGNLPPPPPVRLGVDSPSVLGSYENESKVHNADRRTSNRYKRSSDVSTGRGPATPWKSTPAWSPAANGFMPLQHGPPAGFHPAVQQFPASPLFGVRPVGSYHPHEPNNFSGHARSYGWHNPVDDCPPHLQMWDGSNNMFGHESHVYGRPDWDPNRNLVGNRGWEMSVDMWNGQHGNVNVEFPVPRKEQEYSTQTLADEAWSGQSEHRFQDERAATVLPTADAGGINQSMDTSQALKALGTPPKALLENVSETSNVTSVQETSKWCNNYFQFCCNYLSSLDILPDLVQPELYEQCLSLMGTRDGIVTGNSGHHENDKSQDARVAAKSKNYFLNARSPTSIDVFQRAMSLYKNQKEAMKEDMNMGLGLASSKEDKVPSASDGAKVDVDPPNNMEDDVPMVGLVSASPVEVENKTTTDAESDHPEEMENKHDDPTDAKEKQCGNISESVVMAEGSEDCEALMPECRVNLSRIHLSLESTH